MDLQLDYSIINNVDFLKIVAGIVISVSLFYFIGGRGSSETGFWFVFVLPFLLMVSLIVWIMRKTSGDVEIGKRNLKISQKAYLVILIRTFEYWSLLSFVEPDKITTLNIYQSRFS